MFESHDQEGVYGRAPKVSINSVDKEGRTTKSRGGQKPSHRRNWVLVLSQRISPSFYQIFSHKTLQLGIKMNENGDVQGNFPKLL